MFDLFNRKKLARVIKERDEARELAEAWQRAEAFASKNHGERCQELIATNAELATLKQAEADRRAQPSPMTATGDDLDDDIAF